MVEETAKSSNGQKVGRKKEYATAQRQKNAYVEPIVEKSFYLKNFFLSNRFNESKM